MIPSHLTRNLTRGSFTFMNLITGNHLGCDDYANYQMNSDSGCTQCFRWSVEIRVSLKTYTPPPSIKYIAGLANTPGFQCNKLHQEILLSFFGNGAKEQLTGLGWNPATLLTPPKYGQDEIWEALRVIVPDSNYFEALQNPRIPYQGPRPLYVWIRDLVKYYTIGTREINNLIRLMHENKISLPVKEMASPHLKNLEAFYNFDEQGVILDPKNPTPAKPVMVEPAVEVKKKRRTSSVRTKRLRKLALIKSRSSVKRPASGR